MNRTVSIKFSIGDMDAETIYDMETKDYKYTERVGKRQESNVVEFDSLSESLREVFTILVTEK